MLRCVWLLLRTDVCIQFHNSSILDTKTRYMDRIVREAIEIELHPCNNNREGGFSVNHESLSSAP
jgi:hypothetical protein